MSEPTVASVPNSRSEPIDKIVPYEMSDHRPKIVTDLATLLAGFMTPEYRELSYAALFNSIASTLQEWGVGGTELPIFRDQPRYLANPELPNWNTVLVAMRELRGDLTGEPAAQIDEALETFYRLLIKDAEAEKDREASGW